MKSPLIVTAVAVIALTAGVFAGRLATAPPPVTTATVLDTPHSLPPFSLVADDGGTIDPGRLAGNWTLVFFGFTHCPDVCPTTLATITRGLRDVPEDKRPTVLLVSVDPARDTPENLAGYLAHFDPAYLGATGDLGAIEAFAASVGAVFMHDPDEDGGYTVGHTAALFLLDPQVRLAAIFSAPHDAEAIGADLVAIRARRG